jgi:hypothetical protein
MINLQYSDYEALLRLSNKQLQNEYKIPTYKINETYIFNDTPEPCRNCPNYINNQPCWCILGNRVVC